MQNHTLILICVSRGKLHYCFFFCAPNNVFSLTSVPPPPSLVLSITSRSFVESVTMNSWLVTVLLLASAAIGSGGQSTMGKGVEGWGEVAWGVYQLLCVHFPSQVHKCPSQATHVHNLTYQAF